MIGNEEEKGKQQGNSISFLNRGFKLKQLYRQTCGILLPTEPLVNQFLVLGGVTEHKKVIDAENESLSKATNKNQARLPHTLKGFESSRLI